MEQIIVEFVEALLLLTVCKKLLLWSIQQNVEGGIGNVMILLEIVLLVFSHELINYIEQL